MKNKLLALGEATNLELKELSKILLVNESMTAKIAIGMLHKKVHDNKINKFTELLKNE